MNCPKEFTCALFAEGELPEAEARAVAMHLESCDACDRLVAAFRAENRMLVQCLQDIDSEVSSEVPEFSAAPSISPGMSAMTKLRCCSTLTTPRFG